jgi:hypothetical protein
MVDELDEGAASGRSIRTLGAKARKTSMVLSFGVLTSIRLTGWAVMAGRGALAAENCA